MQSRDITNFRRLSLLNVEGKIFFGVLARRMTTFLMSNHYTNTSIQKAEIPGFPGCLEHSQMICISILTAKRDKTELHVIRLDLTNAYGSVPQHLIRMAHEFFIFPSKVGEIIMKYFNSAFMKFTVKNYTIKWQALGIGIMMGCVISPLLFVLAMELILRGAPNTSKGVMKNEHLTIPPSKAFMDDITILVPFQIAADGLLQRYYDFFRWGGMKSKPKKIRSLSLVGGSVREIHFKIGGDKIPAVREKLVKSLGHLYSIALTNRHRGPEVQKVALKVLKSIYKTCLPGKMKAWCYQHGGARGVVVIAVGNEHGVTSSNPGRD